MFKVGKPVTGNYFFDRSKMLKKVKQLVVGNQDFMIKAPRRYGKTSLIKQALLQSRRPVLYLDLRRVPRLELLAEQIIDFAYDQVGIKGFFLGIKNDAFAFFREHKQSLKINLELFEYSVEFFAKERKPCEMLTEALEIANKVSEQTDAGFIIILDEFQDISRVECGDGDILEVLRGVMQHHDAITYGFLGSIEQMMTQIFENKKSPFYNFCRKLKLTPFDTNELKQQLIGAFLAKGIVFEDEEQFGALLARLEGHPTNTMLVMQNIYFIALDLDIKMVSADMLDDAYENAYFETTDLIEQYIHEVKSKKNHYDVLYRLVRGEKQVLSAAHLYQVFKNLMEMGHLANEARGIYTLNDSFLAEYIRRS